VQRRNTVARSGEEIGLNAPSQPTGTFPRVCCAGDAGVPILSALTAGGGRSPLNVRSTVGGFIVNKPVLGNDGKELKLAAKSAATTAAPRTNKIGRIEVHSDDPYPRFPRVRAC
jgi:hypothetical protein